MPSLKTIWLATREYPLPVKADLGRRRGGVCQGQIAFPRKTSVANCGAKARRSEETMSDELVAGDEGDATDAFNFPSWPIWDGAGGGVC